MSPIDETLTEDPEISVVVPLLDEEDSLRELYSRICQALEPYATFVIVFVDDGSKDASWERIRDLSQEDSRVHGIRLRRNYGKSAALQQGFDFIRSKYVVTMDADLQDDPFEVPEMVNMLKDGYELVSGWKKVRHDPLSKTIPSKFFNFVTSLVAGIHLHDFNCGLKAYRREVLDHITLYGEMHRYVPMLAHWEGFSQITEKVVLHHPRKHGRSKFGLSRFIKGFLDLVTLLFIHTFVQRPMHFFGSIGTLSLSIGAGITLYLSFMRIFFNQYLSGRPLLLFGILFLVLGVQFFSIGFIGELVSKQRASHQPVNVKETV